MKSPGENSLDAPCESENTPHVYEICSGIRTAPLDVTASSPQYIVETSADRRFKVSGGVNALIELLAGADEPLSVSQIVERLQDARMKTATPEKVTWLLEEVLIPRKVARRNGGDESSHQAVEARLPSSYLWIKLPLLTEAAVSALTRPLTPLFSPAVAGLLLFLAVGAHVFFYAQIIPNFELSLSTLSFWDIAVIMAIANLTTMWHELGHATASKRFGVAPGRIGWGIYLFMFVLYADVSRIWRLDRYKRSVVDAGGMYFELIASSALIGALAVYGTDLLVYVVLLINLSIFFSLNPIFRRDGYWLLSDLTGQENLRYASNRTLTQWVQKAFKRHPEPANAQENRPGWLQSLLGFYSVASVLFFAYITVWLGQRIFVEVLPGVKQSAQGLTLALQAGSLRWGDAAEATAQILFGLIFISIVAFTTWSFAKTIYQIAVPSAAPAHAPGARMEWKKAD